MLGCCRATESGSVQQHNESRMIEGLQANFLYTSGLAQESDHAQGLRVRQLVLSALLREMTCSDRESEGHCPLSAMLGLRREDVSALCRSRFVLSNRLEAFGYQSAGGFCNDARSL